MKPKTELSNIFGFVHFGLCEGSATMLGSFLSQATTV
jgi:hypothetical protein